MEYNGEFNPWPDETSMPKLSAEVYLDGDFYLTAGEKKLLAQVEEVYDKIVVVLNIGGVIDLSWIKRDDKIGAALYGGQGGMEGGTAMAQVLCGLVNPSGKLADTFAARLEDYPSTENFHESVEYVDYTEDRLVSYPTLAEYLCVDRSAMMREFKNLSEEGVLFREGKNIRILL